MNNNYDIFWKPKIAFQKVFSDLKQAKKSIYIETFMFGNDSVGRELMEILIKKSLKIPVTIIVDGYGLQNMNNGFRKKIEESKVEFIIFNPVWQYIKKVNIRKWFRSLPYRNHRKLTIIDNTIAYVGGMNYHHSEIKWHDLFSRITGPIVKQLVSASKEMKEIVSKKTNIKKIKNIKQISKIKAKEILHLVGRKINKKNTILFSKNDCITRQIPLSRHRPLKNQLKSLLKTAKKEVCITTPYFIPDPQFHKLLHSAVKRGLKVKLIVPKQSDRTIADVLTKMNLYIAHKAKIEIKVFPKMTHAKYIIADDYMCSFGSANMDYQAFYNNYELNITSQNKELVKKLKKQFDKNWNESESFELKSWKNRSRRHKILERILHPWRKYF